MTDVLSEELLARALKAVARAAVPDSAVPELSGVLNLHGDEEDLDWEVVEASLAPRRRRRQQGRGIGAVVAVLAIGGAGTGIAAAVGAFSPQEEVGVLIGPAMGKVLPTGKWTAANVTTRLTEAGPDGSTLTLQTASADAAGGCIRVSVSPRGTDGTGTAVTCTAKFNASQPPTTHTPSSTNYGTGGATELWISPSGTRWTLVSGRCPTPTAVKAVAVSEAGVIIATTPISKGGWYILPVLTSSTGGANLAYYDPTGHQTNSYPGL